jgi:hypothetical protein
MRSIRDRLETPVICGIVPRERPATISENPTNQFDLAWAPSKLGIAGPRRRRQNSGVTG